MKMKRGLKKLSNMRTGKSGNPLPETHEAKSLGELPSCNYRYFRHLGGVGRFSQTIRAPVRGVFS